MKLIKTTLLAFSITLGSCSSYHPDNGTTLQKKRVTQDFIYTNPKGVAVDLKKISFKTNGMVRTENPDVLGIGGTTYTYTRYGAWNSRTGQHDVFAMGDAPSQQMDLHDDQIYYGRALRSANQSVYDNRLTYALNFNDNSFEGFSVSVPDRYTFGDSIVMHGKMQGYTLMGTVESGNDKGRFSGQFYGPNGIEFVGIARFDNPNLDFSFGGDKQ